MHCGDYRPKSNSQNTAYHTLWGKITMTPSELQSWLEILGKPTMGVVVVVVVILYRDVVIHLFKTIFDVISSWLKRK
jgi:fructose-specific phosphotransferase system IIC component